LSHEIETAAIHGSAWHNAGKRLDHLMTVEEALEESGLGNWMLQKRPLFYFDENAAPAYIEVPDAFAHIRGRDGQFLGTVGRDYASIDNEFGFDVFKLLCDKDGLNIAKIQSSGSLRSGKNVWVLLSLPDSGFTVGNRQDKIIPYLLFTNAHDGTASARFMPTTVNVVCWNTLNAALGEAYAALNVSVRHTGDIKAKMEDVQNMMAQAAMMFGNFQRIGDELDDKVVSQDAFGEVMNFLFPPIDETKATNRIITNRNAKIMLLTSAIKEEVALLPQFTQTGEGGFSYWTLLNGITRFTTHKQAVRIGSSGNTENEARFESQVLGAGAEFNARATKKIMELAEVK
jgi:phage/plasmid-like protein (TIGR03299 family)